MYRRTHFRLLFELSVSSLQSAGEYPVTPNFISKPGIPLEKPKLSWSSKNETNSLSCVLQKVILVPCCKKFQLLSCDANTLTDSLDKLRPFIKSLRFCLSNSTCAEGHSKFSSSPSSPSTSSLWWHGSSSECSAMEKS